MIKGALFKLRNMALHLPGPYLNTYSPINRYASNTVNVWVNSAAYAAFRSRCLTVTWVACGRDLLLIALLKIIRKSSEMEPLSPHKA